MKTVLSLAAVLVVMTLLLMGLRTTTTQIGTPPSIALP